MAKLLLWIFLLSLASLACNLTAQNTPQNATGAILSPSATAWQPTPTNPPALALVTVTAVQHYCVTAHALNLRQEPSEDSPLVGADIVALRGERVTYIAQEDGWLFVQYRGVYGWVNGSYTEVCK